MKVSDIDSIVHLLQSISGWGIAFLILIILPLYTIGWSAVFKLLKINTSQSLITIIIIGVSIIISLISLSIGINKDKKLITQSTLIRNFIISTYSDNSKLSTLKENKYIQDDSTYINKLIERFPESFCYSWVGREPALQLIDSISLNQLEKNVEKVVPIVYSELSNELKKDSTINFITLANNIDSRASWMVLEKIITKYPDKFVEVSTNDTITNLNSSSIKRIKD